MPHFCYLLAKNVDSTVVNRKFRQYSYWSVFEYWCACSDSMMKTNFHMVVPQTKESDVIWTFLTDMIVKIHPLVPNKSPLVFENGLNDIWAHVPVNDNINTKLIEWTDGIANSKTISAITLNNFLNNQFSCLFSCLTKVLLEPRTRLWSQSWFKSINFESLFFISVLKSRDFYSYDFMTSLAD